MEIKIKPKLTESFLIEWGRWVRVLENHKIVYDYSRPELRAEGEYAAQIVERIMSRMKWLNKTQMLMLRMYYVNQMDVRDIATALQSRASQPASLGLCAPNEEMIQRDLNAARRWVADQIEGGEFKRAKKIFEKMKKVKNDETLDASNQFVNLPISLINSRDWAVLRPHTVKLLVDIASQYDGKNNGALCASYSVMEKHGWRSKSTLSLAVRSAIKSGFLIVTRPGAGPFPALYAISFAPYSGSMTMENKMKDKQAILYAGTDKAGSECCIKLGVTKDEYQALTEQEQKDLINEFSSYIFSTWVEFE